ncbi:MAG: hypothetical protein SGBAC_000680 [Bacillariaceae sp.]
MGRFFSIFKKSSKKTQQKQHSTRKASSSAQVENTASRNVLLKQPESSPRMDVDICPSTSTETVESRSEPMSPSAVEVTLGGSTARTSGQGKTPKMNNSKRSSKRIACKGGSKDPLELTRRILNEETKEEPTSSEPSELKVGYMLRDLRESKTVREATSPMRKIHHMLNGRSADKPARKAAAKTIARMNGIPTIIMTVQRFFHEHEHEFSALAIRNLIQLTRFYPDCKENMADIGGADAILKVAESQGDNVMVTANAVGLLCNLSTLWTTQKHVADDRCIDFVIQAMRSHPAHRFIQRNGCAYLSCIGNVDGMQAVFRRKGIDYLLLDTFNSFQDRNDRPKENLFFHKCKEIQAFAKLGMVVYMSKIRENTSDN